MVMDGLHAEIEWNEKIRDPDNWEQKRQIDFTIRRCSSLTIGECRFRQGTQDVRWIEELIGKKQSLRADTIIAVSDSGFTKGAIRKAEAFGVIVRDLETLSDDEIMQWGRRTDVRYTYLLYEKLHFLLGLNSEEIERVKTIGTDGLIADRGQFMVLLDSVAQALYDKLETRVGSWETVDAELNAGGLLLAGIPLTEVKCRARVKLEQRQVALPSICVYGDPRETADERITHIERDSGSKTEVVQAGDRGILTIDFSHIDRPPNAHIPRLFFGMSQIMTMRVRPVGLGEFSVVIPELRFGAYLKK